MSESFSFTGSLRGRITMKTLGFCLMVLCLAGCSEQSTAPSNQQQSVQRAANGSSAQNEESDSTQGEALAVSVKFVESPDNNRQRVEVRGLRKEHLTTLRGSEYHREQWTKLLKISVASNESDDLPAMLGQYYIANDRLIFEPRFPLKPGLKYTARFDPSQLTGNENSSTQIVTAEFSLPEPPASPPAFVQHVYPSRNTLPENQLKFYIHFSAPMSQGEAYDHIHLIESSGKEVDYPFLRLGEELWDPSGTRFTLFIDPGRIKRGLKPREDLGPALEEGKSYTLVVDANWPEADGRKLRDSYKKAFRVIAPDETQPDPKNWKFSSPSSGSTDPLLVTFAEPLDHAMLGRVLVVLDSKGKPLPGKITIDKEETRWQFRPQQPWAVGFHSLQAETTLEDLAGNSIGRPFEVDVFHPIEKKVTTETVSIPFEIQSGKVTP